MDWQEKRKKEIEQIIGQTTSRFSVKKEELLSTSRKKELVCARKFLLNILFELFYEDGMLQEDVSAVINKDRTTFIYHRQKHLTEYSTYKNYKKEFDDFKKTCEDCLEKINIF